MAPDTQRRLRLADIFAYTTVTVMFLTLLLGVYWIFWPVDVLKIHNIDMLDTVVHPGGTVRYIINYDKYLNEPGEVTKMLISERRDKNHVRVYSLTAHFLWALPMGAGYAETITEIPKYIPPGYYRIKYHIRYSLSPLRNFVEEFETPYFKVE